MISQVLPIDNVKEQKKIMRSFALYCLGVFLSWSVYVSIFNLQSSINVEKGLGVVTLSISFVASLVFAMFFVPVLVRKYGAKFWLVIGDAAMLPFILANLYPKYYTMVPAGIIMTSLGAAMWPSMSALNVLFATQYSGVSKRLIKHHTLYFSGYFYVAFQSSQVFGNMLSYVVLYGFDQIPIPSYDAENCTGNVTCEFDEKYSSCAASDCQNSTEISENLNQYKPVKSISFYVLVGIIITLDVIAVMTHFFFVPGVKTFEKKIESYKLGRHLPLQNMENSGESEYENKLITEEADSLDTNGDISHKDSKQKAGFIALSKATFRHIIRPKLLLMIPITVYNGLSMSFAFTELTRAYTSCVLGVQWVGICMAVFGLADAIMSYITGKFGRKIRRITIFFIILILDCGNYMYCFFWSPGEHMLLSIVAAFFMFGFTDGVLQTIINVTHIDFFSENHDIALNVWNVFIVFGFSTGSALSRALCVHTRIYFNISFLIIGFIGLAFADVLHRKHVAEAEKMNK